MNTSKDIINQMKLLADKLPCLGHRLKCGRCVDYIIECPNCKIQYVLYEYEDSCKSWERQEKCST